MREVLDRIRSQLMARLPVSDGVAVAYRVELSELAAIASAARDYAEAELIYKQATQGDVA